MPFSPEGYVKRAQECLRLARAARDVMVRSELLQLRQIYLQLAHSLEEETSGHESTSPFAGQIGPWH